MSEKMIPRAAFEKVKLRPPSQLNTRGGARYSYYKKSLEVVNSCDRGSNDCDQRNANLNKSNVSSNGSFANNSGYNCKNYE